MSAPPVPRDLFEQDADKTLRDPVALRAWMNAINGLVGVASAVYAMHVTFAGIVPTEVFLPDGWSFTRTGAGAYTITHNLNTTTYAIALTGQGAGGGNTLQLVTLSANSFTMSQKSAGAATDGSFQMLLTVQD